MIDNHVVIWAILALVVIMTFLRVVEGYSGTGDKKCQYM